MEGNFHDEYMDLSNLDIPIKTNIKVPGKFKYQFGKKNHRWVSGYYLQKHINWHAASRALLLKRKQ